MVQRPALTADAARQPEGVRHPRPDPEDPMRMAHPVVFIPVRSTRCGRGYGRLSALVDLSLENGDVKWHL
jgi:hypothetical protein